MRITLFIIILLTIFMYASSAEERSFLDNFLFAWRPIKAYLTNNLVRVTHSEGATRNLKKYNKLQDLPSQNEFPCSLNGTRSTSIPNSVHKLRPGDIDVIGAIGDSLMAGFGLSAVKNVFDVFLEDRGRSFSIGGEGTWREYVTLPNILKEFNSNLYGYSLRASASTDSASRFNVAEGGAISKNTPYMTKVLIKRIKSDRNVDLQNSWKLINFMIGANDFCSEICYYKNPEVSLEKHKSDLITVLRLLRDNLPRTMVNLILPPHIKILYDLNLPPICKFYSKVTCPCIFGLAHSNREREHLFSIMTRWQKLDEEIANLPEFNSDNFTVIAQNFMLDYKWPTKPNGLSDESLLSADCFHFSQKGTARVANDLWNAMLEPIGQKEVGGRGLFKKFRCPTEENPYIFTRQNSFIDIDVRLNSNKEYT